MAAVCFGEAELNTIVVSLRRNVVWAGRRTCSRAPTGCAIEEIIEAVKGLVDAFSGINDDKGFASDSRIKDGRVFDGMIQSPTISARFKSKVGRDLILR